MDARRQRELTSGLYDDGPGVTARTSVVVGEGPGEGDTMSGLGVGEVD